MRFHFILLFLLLISPFAVFKRLRTALEISFPVILMVFSILQKDYSETVLGTGGVSVSFDKSSELFVMGASISFLMVAIERFSREKSFRETFLFLTSLLTLSAVFISRDLFNVYVLMEVLSVQAGLMASEAREKKALWATLKYLIIGGVGANLYLVGVAIQYSKSGSFSMSGSYDPLALSFMVVGLMMRAGFFGTGMWLPQFHSSVSDELSALFSGAFIGAAVYPLWMISRSFEAGRWIFPTSSALGVLVSALSNDYKRILAGSTMSHLYMVVKKDPSLYYLSHAIAKTYLFLKSSEVKKGKIGFLEKISALLAASSLAGFPFTLGGFAEDFFGRFVSTASSLFVFSKIARLKTKKTLRPVSIFPFLLIFPYLRIESLTSLFAVLGILIKKNPEKKIFLEDLEWNVVFSAILLMGVVLCS